RAKGRLVSHAVVRNTRVTAGGRLDSKGDQSQSAAKRRSAWSATRCAGGSRGVEIPMQSSPFKLSSEFTPKGDQPQAIAALCKGLDEGYPMQALLGITGS